jgi:hypothetical protein
MLAHENDSLLLLLLLLLLVVIAWTHRSTDCNPNRSFFLLMALST